MNPLVTISNFSIQTPVCKTVTNVPDGSFTFANPTASAEIEELISEND